jgi:hypothetical protein
LKQKEFLISRVGHQFKNVGFPDGPYWGGRNPWDAAQDVRGLIAEIASDPGGEARSILIKLLVDRDLDSYHYNLKHAIAQQAEVRRRALYSQPSWSQTCQSLQGGVPANPAELHALIISYLQDISMQIRHSNTDSYKQFWRCDSSARTQAPQVEDYCRDRLIDLLRAKVNGLKVRVEPEGHMARDKRADIVITTNVGVKVPIELKRDSHAKVMSACTTQLDRWYTRDPETGGFGIYGVFWFGNKLDNKRKRNSKIESIANANEMEMALRRRLSPEEQYYLGVIVIDVSDSIEISKKRRHRTH